MFADHRCGLRTKNAFIPKIEIRRVLNQILGLFFSKGALGDLGIKLNQKDPISNREKINNKNCQLFF